MVRGLQLREIVTPPNAMFSGADVVWGLMRAGFAVVDANPALDRVTSAIFERVPALADLRPVPPAPRRSPGSLSRSPESPSRSPDSLSRPASPGRPAQARP